MRIETHRLTLIPQTLEHLRIELEEPGRLGVMLNARVPPGWPPGEYDRDAMESWSSIDSRASPSANSHIRIMVSSTTASTSTARA